MNISKHIIIHDILIPSLKQLYKRDYLNIKYQVSERNICARLSLHMESIMREYDKSHSSYLFCDYYADVEYNRMSNGDLKTFENNECRPQYMVSDLLIHSRKPTDNYLAVEMKRKGNRKCVAKDKDRLCSIVSSSLQIPSNQCVYNTLVGAFIEYSPKSVMINIFEDMNGRGMHTESIYLIYDSNVGLLLSIR